MSIAERLQKHSIPEPNSGCLLWTGAVNAGGYGVICIDRAGRLAHRVSYELTHGPLPKGMCACHKCDVPACINPAHLFAGTQVENIRDRDRKGRTRESRGEKNNRAKLNASDVAEIRKAAGSRSRIAEQYGVSIATIDDIRYGRSWRHVT